MIIISTRPTISAAGENSPNLLFRNHYRLESVAVTATACHVRTHFPREALPHINLAEMVTRKMKNGELDRYGPVLSLIVLTFLFLQHNIIYN